jgi:alkylation response protein AidB-like acyl-CoA dehydrogenase
VTATDRAQPAPGPTVDWANLRPALVTAAQAPGEPHAIDSACFTLLKATGAFRSLLAPERGGPGGADGDVDPAAVMDLIEECAAIRGALGWTAFVGVTGGLFDAELAPEAAAEVYADPDAMVAYAGAPTGTLTPDGDGYTLTGRWAVVSGLSHAAWVALGARIAGVGTTAVAILPRDQCVTEFAWEPVGLSGTGTGSAVVERVRVPAAHVVVDGGDEPADRRRGRYRSLIPGLIASVSLGIARGGLDALATGEPVVSGGPHAAAGPERVRDVVGRAWAQIHAARAFVHQATLEMWRSVRVGADPGLEVGARLRLAATHAADVGAEVTTTLVGLAGTAGVTSGHPLARRWLDARTVTANVTVRGLYYRVYGGVRLYGEAPESWP